MQDSWRGFPMISITASLLLIIFGCASCPVVVVGPHHIDDRSAAY